MSEIKHQILKVCADGQSALCQCRSIHPLKDDGELDTTRDLEDGPGFRAYGIHPDALNSF